MIKQKKQAIKRLFKTIEQNRKKLPEKCFFKHMDITCFNFLKFSIRYKIEEIVFAEYCIKNNHYDQCSLVMESENNCGWIKGFIHSVEYGQPHCLSKNPLGHIEYFNEKYLDIPFIVRL